MIKKWEVRITKITSATDSPIVKEIPHGIHYYDDEKDARRFYDTWKPSTRLWSFRIRLISVTEHVNRVRETPSIQNKLKKIPKP